MARAAGKTPAKRRIEPFAQGDLDGMCAIYTIINAVRALCPEMTTGASMALFRRLIRSLDTHTNDARNVSTTLRQPAFEFKLGFSAFGLAG